MLPAGPIVLTILLVLITFGLLERVLDRMRLSGRVAMLLAAGMLMGSLLDIDLAPGLRINVGGGLLPLAVVFYLMITANHWHETARGVAAAVVTAGVVYLIGRWFPPGEPTELNLFFLDAQYLFGLCGGLVGYLAGRSRRSAFCASVGGVIMADLAHYMGYVRDGLQDGLLTQIGGGGFQDTAVVAGVLAVLLAELIGESREALQGGPAAAER